MESVTSNAMSTTMYANTDERSPDKDLFIKHLQSELKETLTVHYKMVDQLIYKCNQLCKKLRLSLRKCEEEKSQLLNVIEGVKGENIVLKRQIEKLEGFLKPNKTRDDGLINESNDEPLTAMKRQTVEETESDSLLSTRISSGSQKSDDSVWNPIGRLTKNLPFAHLWNSMTLVFWTLFSVLKTRKTTVSEAGVQTESRPSAGETCSTVGVQTEQPSSAGETRAAGVQTVASAYRNAAAQTTSSVCGNAAVQTDPAATTATTAIQTDSWTRDTSVVATQTGATDCHTIAVQTNTPACRATAVQTDPLARDVVASQTDSVAYGTVAVQTNADPPAGQRTVPLTFNTFSQTDETIVAVQSADSVAFVRDASDAAIAVLRNRRDDDVSVETLTDPSVHDSIAVRTESFGAETTGVQTESFGAETTGVQTESFGAETTGVQTESFGAETIGVQTESFGAETIGAETIGVQTESVGAETIGVQTESFGAETIGVQTESVGADGFGGTDTTAVQTDLTIAGTDVAANQTDPNETGFSTVPVDSPAHETVGVQTEESIGCSAAVVDTQLDNSRLVIDKLTDMFGCGDNNVALNNRAVNLKAVLKKIELVGFKSLCFQELSFVHQKVVDNSVSLCKKYSSLIEIAVKHLPSWQRGSIKQKHDIVHMFATLDRLVAMKNKEIDTFKIDLASEIQKRKKVEENLLLTQEKCEKLVEENETLANTNDERNRNLIDTDNTYDHICPNNRFSYDEIVSGKFLEYLDLPEEIDE